MKTLTWHFAGPIHTDRGDDGALRLRRGGGSVKQVRGHSLPVACRTSLGQVSTSGTVSIDIRTSDGNSIFPVGVVPGCIPGDTVTETEVFAAGPEADPNAQPGIPIREFFIKDGDTLTLVVTAEGNNARALTVELDLEDFDLVV